MVVHDYKCSNQEVEWEETEILDYLLAEDMKLEKWMMVQRQSGGCCAEPGKQCQVNWALS